MSLGAFNQGSWFGVGDWDECWIVATYWALVAAGVMRREDLPSIKKFRDAAGKPDRRGPTGGNIKDLLLAINTLIPEADARLYVGGVAGFERMLKRGYIASLSVDSGDLPSYLQFGFKGLHQIAVYAQGGKFYVMNPLQKEGSALIEISRRDLMRAAGSLFNDGKFHTLFIRKKGEKALAGLAERSLPVRPRDLNAPVVVRDYIDPYETRSRYNGRRPRPYQGP